MIVWFYYIGFEDGMQEIGMDETAAMGYNRSNQDSISLKTGIMHTYQSK